MISIPSVTVTSFDLDQFVINWTVDLKPVTTDIMNFRFFIERSNSEEGPFDVLNASPGLTNIFTFADRQINRLSKWRRFFYRIRAVDISVTPNVEVVSDVAFINIESLTMQRRQQLEMIRLEKILLSGVGVVPGFVGVKCLLFKRRSFGQRCPECWDDIKRKITRSNCETCFTTGFRFGYHTPIVTFISFDALTDQPQLSPISESQPVKLRAWTSNYPIVVSGDLLIDQENRRWLIENTTHTELLRSITRQLMTLYSITPGTIEYSVPFDPNLLS